MFAKQFRKKRGWKRTEQIINLTVPRPTVRVVIAPICQQFFGTCNISSRPQCLLDIISNLSHHKPNVWVEIFEIDKKPSLEELYAYTYTHTRAHMREYTPHTRHTFDIWVIAHFHIGKWKLTADKLRPSVGMSVRTLFSSAVWPILIFLLLLPVVLINSSFLSHPKNAYAHKPLEHVGFYFIRINMKRTY